MLDNLVYTNDQEEWFLPIMMQKKSEKNLV